MKTRVFQSKRGYEVFIDSKGCNLMRQTAAIVYDLMKLVVPRKPNMLVPPYPSGEFILVTKSEEIW